MYVPSSLYLICYAPCLGGSLVIAVYAKAKKMSRTVDGDIFAF